MPLRAVCLLRSLGDIAFDLVDTGVLLLSHWLQVVWPHAPGVLAGMVKYQTLGKRAVAHLPGQPVRIP